MHLTARPVTARRPKPPSWHTGHFPPRAPPQSFSRRCFGLAARHNRFRCVPRPRWPTRRSPSPAASRASRTGRGRGHRQARQLIARSVRWRSETTRKHPAICQVTSSKRPKPAGLPPACLHRTVTAWRLHGMRYPPICMETVTSTRVGGDTRNGSFWCVGQSRYGMAEWLLKTRADGSSDKIYRCCWQPSFPG